MVDWITLFLGSDNISEELHKKLYGMCDKTYRCEPDGTVKHMSLELKSLRSDFQGMAFHYSNNGLRISGSPASCVHRNNAFGTGDLIQSFNHLRQYLERAIGLPVPASPYLWSCSRIDYNLMFDLGNQTAVLSSLDYLKNSKTRGDNVERRNTTVYWNKGSSYLSYKAYSKFQHAVARNNISHFYTEDELQKLQGLLRLEMQIGRKFIQKHNLRWYEMTESNLIQLHKNHFDKVIGNVSIPSQNELLDKLKEICPSENQALAAFNTWCNIRNVGLTTIKNSMSKASYYRHIKFLKEAGLSLADLNSGQILPFRQKLIVLGEPVKNFKDVGT